jgi:hypothetical protein
MHAWWVEDARDREETVGRWSCRVVYLASKKKKKKRRQKKKKKKGGEREGWGGRRRKERVKRGSKKYIPKCGCA